MSGGARGAGRNGAPAAESSPPKPAAEGSNRAALEAALLAAHAAADQPALVGLYTRAADGAEAAGDVDAACFYLTHAYVFALATGAPEAGVLHARLKAHGREE